MFHWMRHPKLNLQLYCHWLCSGNSPFCLALSFNLILVWEKQANSEHLIAGKRQAALNRCALARYGVSSIPQAFRTQT